MADNEKMTPPRRPMGHGHGHGPRMGTGEKSKDLVGTWKKLIKSNKGCFALVMTALVCAAVSTVMTLIGPDKLKDLTNIISAGIMTEINMDKVLTLCVTLVIFYAVGMVLSLSQNLIMASVTQKITKSMRQNISVKINKLPISYYNRSTTGDVLSRVTNDVDAIGQSLNMSVGNLVSSLVMLLGSLFMMFKTNFLMTVTAIVASVIGFMLMGIIMGKSQKYFIMQQQHLRVSIPLNL